MSSFSLNWLSLREPYDHRARNREVCDAAAAAFHGRQHLTVADLASGTGSNLRALAPHFPKRQTWRLIDSDPCLLSAAFRLLLDYADDIKVHNPLTLQKNGRQIEVHFICLDLRSQLNSALCGDINLVTAAAFFDLVSADWIDGFCLELISRKLPLYAALNYSGKQNWCPPHLADSAIVQAFHLHQRTCKGFGPAAGPAASSFLELRLRESGYSVAAGVSPWRLGRKDAALISALADGIARAVCETGLVPQTEIEKWRAARVDATKCEIGHTDFFAVPRGG